MGKFEKKRKEKRGTRKDGRWIYEEVVKAEKMVV